MIESEEMRKQITADIKRWAEWVRIIDLLRPGDIVTLVNTILQRFYKVTLCCGHLVKTLDESVCLEIKNGEYGGCYCRDCAEKMIEGGYAQEKGMTRTGANKPDDIGKPETWNEAARQEVEAILRRLFDKLSDTKSWDKEAKQIADEILELLSNKQHDYGHGNINAFGELGLLVRTNDKLERLKNLYGKEGISEPRVDAWMDIAGYSIIALMLGKGTFSLELKEE